MNRIGLYVSIFFTICLNSCTTDKVENKPDSDITIKTEYGEISGKYIHWFKESTGEIRFKDLEDFPEGKLPFNGIHGLIEFYQGDVFLFPAYSVSPFSSKMAYGLLLDMPFDEEWTLSYPFGDNRYSSNIPELEKIKNDNQEGWDIFIEQLKKEGRYKK